MSRFTDYQIRPAQPEDVELLGPNLREIDRREIRALSGQEPMKALAFSFERSARVFSAVTGGGEIIQMWGVGSIGPLLGLVGMPWLLASDILERPEVAREFIRQSRPYARKMEEGFVRLENRVHAENRLAIRWLKWLGYSFADQPERWGGEDFYLFWRNC